MTTRIARNVALEMALQQRAMGRRIAQLRERTHLTQEAAADQAGVTLRAYQKWEAGGGIQYSNLLKLAEVFRVDVSEITGETESPSPFRVSDQINGVRDEFRDDVSRLHADMSSADQAQLNGRTRRRWVPEVRHPAFDDPRLILPKQEIRMIKPDVLSGRFHSCRNHVARLCRQFRFAELVRDLPCSPHP